MNILITGVHGFIGKKLAAALIARHHYVIGLGRQETTEVKNITYIQGDILDTQAVQKAMKGVHAVVHLAALTAHKDIVDNKFQALETNLKGTQNILQAFTKSKTAAKFIYSSTGKVYGKIQSLPITEEHPTLPLNSLGKSKLITEQLIDFYATPHKSSLIFRIFNVYGPQQKENFLIPTILKQLEHSTSITLGDVKAQRDYTFIDDIINAFVLALEKDLPGGVSIFNLCSQQGISAEEIVNIIGTIKKEKINLTINHNLIRKDESPEEYGSFQKAKKVLGWEPKISLQEGLQKTLYN